jgi:hypothetical protein
MRATLGNTLLAWGGSINSNSFGEPVVLLMQLNVQGKMGKIATVVQFARLKAVNSI